ncbi:MAG: hypothetical protein ABL956_13960 [Hyphomonadaceae bacterium]
MEISFGSRIEHTTAHAVGEGRTDTLELDLFRAQNEAAKARGGKAKS